MHESLVISVDAAVEISELSQRELEYDQLAEECVLITSICCV